MKKLYVLTAMAFLSAALVILWACKHPISSAEEAVLEEASSSEEAVSEETIFEEATSEEATSEEAVSEEAAPEEATSEEATSEEAISEEASSEETVPEETVPVQPVTRTITVDMYDSMGDGWGGYGALRINVNGIEIAKNIKVSNLGTANTPIGQRNANTYTFPAATGDLVQLYWVDGTSQGDNSFIVYYADTPPSPEFSTDNKGSQSWNGTNALVYRLRGTMGGITGGTLLGTFTVGIAGGRPLHGVRPLSLERVRS